MLPAAKGSAAHSSGFQPDRRQDRRDSGVWPERDPTRRPREPVPLRALPCGRRAPVLPVAPTRPAFFLGTRGGRGAPGWGCRIASDVGAQPPAGEGPPPAGGRRPDASRAPSRRRERLRRLAADPSRPLRISGKARPVAPAPSIPDPRAGLGVGHNPAPIRLQNPRPSEGGRGLQRGRARLSGKI